MKINWKYLVISFFIVFLIAFIGSLFTSNTDSEWFEQTKPEITPPDFVFPIVWNILFFLIALSFYFALVNSEKKAVIIAVYGINFILNILWSLFYFELQNPLLAFFDIFLLIFSIILMIFVAYKESKLASYLLIPYLLWVLFAAVLNYLSI